MSNNQQNKETAYIKNAKHLFMTFRNGIIAETLRKAGMPYKIIFGLQIPQISEIAKELIQNLSTEEISSLADELWNDKSVRESRLLACYLFKPEDTSYEKAKYLANDTITNEECDILCFRILKKLPFAAELADNLQGYCGTALRRNLS